MLFRTSDALFPSCALLHAGSIDADQAALPGEAYTERPLAPRMSRPAEPVAALLHEGLRMEAAGAEPSYEPSRPARATVDGEARRDDDAEWRWREAQCGQEKAGGSSFLLM